MRTFKTGVELEEYIFGPRLEAPDMSSIVKESGDQRGQRFAIEVLKVIAAAGRPYPDTKFGKLFHNSMVECLRSKRIDPKGFVFLPALDTAADYFYQTDGVLYVPSLHPKVVTIDAFNVTATRYLELKEKWKREWSEAQSSETLRVKYSEQKFQSDLYRFKQGWKVWMRDREEGVWGSSEPDFRDLCPPGKRLFVNHFILTPYDLPRHTKFAEMVSGYFSRAAETLKKQAVRP